MGYKLSPLLRAKVAKGLSAGRVQSVAVRLIVDREREIQAFKAEEYWKIFALVAPEGTVDVKTIKRKVSKKKKADDDDQEESALPETPPGAVSAELAEWKEKKFEAGNAEAAQAVVQALTGAAYTVDKIEEKERQEKAAPPFTTSTLQQTASIRLHFTAKRTMMIAQRLYEGVELGSEGSVGLITYMRTDSTRVSEDALKSCREVIETKFGKPYLPGSANRFASGKKLPRKPTKPSVLQIWHIHPKAFGPSCATSSSSSTR